MSLESFVAGIFHWVKDFFDSAKVKSVEQQIQNVMPIALTVVQEFDSFLPPNGKIIVDTVVAFATKYVLPLDQAALTSDLALKNAAQNLVMQVVQKNLPTSQATIAVNIINAAVTSAVALAHAN